MASWSSPSQSHTGLSGPSSGASPNRRNQEKPSPPSFSTPAEFVSVIVSDDDSESNEEHKFVIHKDLICFHSPYFLTAFSSGFIEGKTQEMQLGEVDIATFGQLVQWLYTQKLERTDITDLVLMAKLWMLADRTQASK
jgi:BTB/POZ domain